MSEDEAIFDASLKKKKKKKKTPFNLDAAMAGESQPSQNTEAEEPSPTDENEENTTKEEPKPQTEEVSLEDDFLNLTKKKKKKKKVFDMSEMDNALPKDDAPTEEVQGGDDGDDVPETAETDDIDFNLPSKKKKKKKVKMLEEELELEGEDVSENVSKAKGTLGWIDTDRDYTYDELLKRVFDIMREKNPDMVAGEKKRFIMKPPQVMRVGTKKSSFSNFSDICKMLHRQPKHLLAFLLAELGTSGSIDGNNQLIIKGRFLQKQIESVLRRYIKEYVTCHTCRSPETILQKDTRLYFLQCETCGSRCSVASIKSGFQAVTGKRSAIRAKTT